jgi:iron complex transport system ATP-binding protein
MRLEVKDLEFGYGDVTILKGISMELAPSELLALVGPNGTGKSTLMRCIDKIITPRKGTVLVDGVDTAQMSSIERAKRIGYVPQGVSQVFPTTVFDTVLMGRHPYFGWWSGKEDEDRVLDVLQMMELEEFAMRSINDLSGGQQQKVFIARALVQEADILLLDEPVSALDIKHQLEVMNTVRNIVKEKDISAIISIHDLNLASRYADRLLMMYGGTVFATGSSSEVLTKENLEHVYGVEAEVTDLANGRHYIDPAKPIT